MLPLRKAGRFWKRKCQFCEVEQRWAWLVLRFGVIKHAEHIGNVSLTKLSGNNRTVPSWTPLEEKMSDLRS